MKGIKDDDDDFNTSLKIKHVIVGKDIYNLAFVSLIDHKLIKPMDH